MSDAPTTDQALRSEERARNSRSAPPCCTATATQLHLPHSADAPLALRPNALAEGLELCPLNPSSRSESSTFGRFQVEETSGWVCVGMRGADLDRLQLPLLVPPLENDEALRTAFAMPVDLAAGTTTGIDAHDRQGFVYSLLAGWMGTAAGAVLQTQRSVRMLLK